MCFCTPVMSKTPNQIIVKETKTILGIGGVCIDHLAVVPRMPDWDEIEHISRHMMQQGGMVATAMVAAARLGEKIEYLGGVGNDAAGHYALETFKKGHVGTARVKVFDNEDTAFSLVLVHEKSGKRTILHSRGVQKKLSLEVPVFDLSDVAFLHLDGYWFETALNFAKAARLQGIPVSLDPSSKLLHRVEAESLLPYVDYMIPSAAFARQFSGKENLFEAAQHFLTYGARTVIITNGKDGCFISTPAEHFHLPAFNVPVVDTTGAGDTFHGAFLAGLNKGYALRQVLRFASAAAALKCTKLGGQSGIPTLMEIRDFLKMHGVVL